MDTIISASILNADMSELGTEMKHAVNNGADWIHLDVMDGVFVDCITYGDYMVKALRKHTDLIFDTHLMVYDPTKLIKHFAEAGSDIITIHEESNCDKLEVLRSIRSLGLKAGISINPDTPVEKLFPYLEEADMVLVMAVNPGYGGQGFISDTLSKISVIKEITQKLGLNLNIEVDGGINEKTAGKTKKAGANVLVAGSYLFNSSNMEQSIKLLKQA